MKRYIAEKGRFQVLTFIIVTIVLCMTACGVSSEEGVEVVRTKDVAGISVELFDKSTKLIEGDAVDEVVNMLEKAEITGGPSVQDVPDADQYGKITINDGEETLYYYKKDNMFYIEKPYEAIYEIPIDVDDALMDLTSR